MHGKEYLYSKSIENQSMRSQLRWNYGKKFWSFERGFINNIKKIYEHVGTNFRIGYKNAVQKVYFTLIKSYVNPHKM